MNKMARTPGKKGEIDLPNSKPTIAQLGVLFGTSGRWVSELRSRGALPADGASLTECVQAWGAHLVSAHAPGEAEDLDSARTRLANAQAEAVERKNAVNRGELAPRSEMVSAGIGVITMAVARLQQIGAQVAQGDTKLRKRVETAINDALTDLSMTRVEEAMGGIVDGEDDPEPTTNA